MSQLMAWPAKISAHLGRLPGTKRCAPSKTIGWMSAKLEQTKRTGAQPLNPNPHSHIHRLKLTRMLESSEERCDAADEVVAPSSIHSLASDAHPRVSTLSSSHPAAAPLAGSPSPFSEPDVHDDGGSGGGGALGHLLSNLCPGLDERWQGGDPGSSSRSLTATDPVNKKKQRWGP
jgi:hypothetical protein